MPHSNTAVACAENGDASPRFQDRLLPVAHAPGANGSLSAFLHGAAKTITGGFLAQAGALADTMGLTPGRENVFNSNKTMGLLIAQNEARNRAKLREVEAEHTAAFRAGQVSGAFALRRGRLGSK